MAVEREIFGQFDCFIYVVFQEILLIILIDSSLNTS